MYLLNEKNKLVRYDLNFNNSNAVIHIAEELSNGITIEESTKKESELQTILSGENQSIFRPVYTWETNPDNTMKVFKYKSKTPYTLALIAYYSKNNVVQKLYSTQEFVYGKQIYLQKLVDRLMANFFAFPQMYMTKCQYDGETYQDHHELFESLRDNKSSLDFLIEAYYPDLKAFIELFPYIDFILETEFVDDAFEEDSRQVIAAKYNTETLKQLGLTPNIRK